jgi:hypothetical protein
MGKWGHKYINNLTGDEKKEKKKRVSSLKSSKSIHSVAIHYLFYGGIVDIKPVKKRQDL